MWMPYDYTGGGDLYPGDSYVDMVGASCYAPIGAGATFNSYSELVSHGKPVGIGEFGPGNPPVNNSYNYANLIAAIKASYPNVVWVNQWWAGYSMVYQFGGSTFMADPWIIDRSEITVH
jgi:beta-mannanase